MARFVRWVGAGHARKAGRGAPALLGDAAHKEAARALLHGRALDGVDAQVEAKVDEARERDAGLGVLCAQTGDEVGRQVCACLRKVVVSTAV